MTEEQKPQPTFGPPGEDDTQSGRAGARCDNSPSDPPEEPSQNDPENNQSPGSAARKKRATRAEIDDRNGLVALAVAEFLAKHERLPTVGDIVAETGYSRRHIYSTTSYKQGRITRDSGRSTSKTTAGRVVETEHCREEPIEDRAATGPSAENEIAVDVLMEQRDGGTKDVGAIELTSQDSRFCHLCRSRISPERRTEYECPRCGNGACSSCLELMDTVGGLCFSCDSQAKRHKAVWDMIAFVGIAIILGIILFIALACLFPDTIRSDNDPLGY